jgi:L-seryl-tRNA(Ser) seleniumtransferase
MDAHLRGVVNATGVILHTNLGRAPLSRSSIEAMVAVTQAYANVEFNLQSGKRGDRMEEIEALLTRLTGAERALVVNNNASAVLLALSALAARKRVIIGRSQLVEIGGGFRMPDVMRLSGVKLVEVGTTNKVHLGDYVEHFAGACAILRVHRSNFKMVGFTEEPQIRELAEAAHHAGLLVIDDLGSGALLDTAAYGLAHEPMVQESVEAGADLVCFSGDKLMGGPQSGILVGRGELIAKIGRHALARAVRVDKSCLAGLAATARHYLKSEADGEIPVWRMIAMRPDEIRARAENWRAALGFGEVRSAEATLGGGSLPGETLPSYVLALPTQKVDATLGALRRQDPPTVARTEKNLVLFDARTVLPGQDEALLGGIRKIFKESR